MDLCEKIEHLSNFISHYKVHKEYGGDSFYEYVVEELFSSDGDNKAHHNGSHEDHSPTHSHHQCYHTTVFITTSSGVTLNVLASLILITPESLQQIDLFYQRSGLVI